MEQTLSLSLVSWLSHFQRLKANCFVEWPSICVVWGFLMIRFRLGIFDRNIKNLILCSSNCILPIMRWLMISFCLITDAVHFDHLAKVVPARLVYCKISFLVITKYCVGKYLETLKISFLIKRHIYSFIAVCAHHFLISYNLILSFQVGFCYL